MKPDFIGIGAQKCASTWLYRILSEHPEVVVPQVKELDFFSYHFDRGYRWYEAQFPDSDLGKRRGEFSPSYFHDLAAPTRVQGYAPDVRLLLTLRDPVERALSNHRHEVRLGHLPGSDLSVETGIANNPMYVEQGLYARHLRNWLEHFPREQIFVALMDDIRARPHEVAAEVFQFVGVEPTYRPQGLDRQFNRSHATRSSGLGRIKDAVYAVSRRGPLRWLWSFGVGLGFDRLYQHINVIESDDIIPEPRQETISALRECFHADIEDLEELLGCDLSPWKASASDVREPSSVSSRS